MGIRIAFFSFADIDNFGDILFSHVFKMEIEKRIRNAHIDFYTPTKYHVEGIDYIAYSREKIKQSVYDALVVFGGEVIHLYDNRTWKPIYQKKNQKLETELPSDVIFDWTDFPEPYKAWISVGVRPIVDESDVFKIQRALNNLNYVSTRGNLSKKILENLDLQYNNTKIEITPDLGWLFPNLLNFTNTKGKLYRRHISSRIKKYLVFQINSIDADEAEKIAKYLLEFQKNNNYKIVLLPVIRPWEDYKYLKMIYNTVPGEFLLLDNNLSMLEIADVIVHSSLVVTSSLHANITALSVGIPGGIINKWQGTKLQDLYGHQFRLDKLEHDIDQIPNLLSKLLKEMDQTISLRIYAEFMKIRLGYLFDQLVANITNKQNG